MVAGLLAVAIGLALVSSSPTVGFDLGRGIGGVIGELSTTFGPAVSVLLATGMNVLAGMTLVRLMRGAPFLALGEALVVGAVGAIAVDLVCLFALGPFGLFRPLTLALVNLGLIGAGVLLVRPWFVPGVPGAPRVDVSAMVLVAVVWSVPLILQLASPVPAFIDVLPNHVAPVAHLHAYGTWETLGVSPSPIYGDSRLFLGYVALLGTLTGLTDLPASLVVSAFALPLSILFAAAARHLARSIVGERPSGGLGPASDRMERHADPRRDAAGFWVLLTVPLTFAFLRLPDARASVLAFVPVAFVLALLIGEGHWAGRSRPLALALGIGGTLMVHPPTGVLLLLSVALIGLASPVRLRVAWSGVIGGLVIASPQLAMMAGYSGPAWMALPLGATGLVIAGLLGGAAPPQRGATRGDSPTEGGPETWILGVVGVGILVLIGVLALAAQPDILANAVAAAGSTILDWWLLVAGLAVAVLLLRSLTGWLVLGVAGLVGFVAVAVADAFARLAPGWPLLAETISYEVPKSVGYWLPWFAGIAAGVGIALLWVGLDRAARLRVGLVTAFVIVASVSLHPDAVDPEAVRQHPYAETLAIALQGAQNGYWVGYPDTRLVIDAQRRELVAAVQGEQRAGRMGPDTALLHVAPSFQQWDATPLGVFTGVMETDATEDPEASIHTKGGRLLSIDSLGTLLGRAYPYLVIEGYPDSAGYLARAISSGYRPIWRNERAILLSR